MTAISRDELQGVLLKLTNIAAKAILPHFRRPLGIDNKLAIDNGFDPVTVADRQAELAIRQEIERAYPNHSIFGEEFGDKNGEEEYSWVIDPIDGTRAFVCGLPTWAILIAVCLNEKPILGVMSQPIVGDLFIGGMGKAELRSKKGTTTLSTEQQSTKLISDSILFATTPDMFSGEEISAFNALAAQTKMTRFGVDSYAYCMLAAGYIDLVVEAGLGFYDIAALIPIIEAAGGIVTDWAGKPVRGGGQVIAARSVELHQQALTVLQAKL